MQSCPKSIILAFILVCSTPGFSTVYSVDNDPTGFVSWVASLENDAKQGYDERSGLWFPHVSLEGGADTIAYGHKIQDAEDYTNGITEDEAIALLEADLQRAESIVVSYYREHLGCDFNTLPADLQELAVENVFNIGNCSRFKKFHSAIAKEDRKTAEKESKRFYKTSTGQRKELTTRNKLVHERFFAQE